MEFIRKWDIGRRSFSVFSQLLIMKLIRKPRPVLMYLHLTNRCNLRCSYCYANVNGRFDNSLVKDLSTNNWISLINDAYELGARYFHLYGGEPLLRKDIEEIVAHCLSKNILVEIMTNGHLVPKHIDLLKKVHSICLSLDGEKKVNDAVRGKGNFDAVDKAVRICSVNDIPVRLHSTINKFNIDRPDYLPLKAQKWGTTVSYSVPHVHEYLDKNTVSISMHEVKQFLAQIVQLKRQGLPIDNTYEALGYAMDWPFNSWIVKDSFGHQQKIKKQYTCPFGKSAVVVDSEGYIIKCINLNMHEGLQFQKVGFKKAYRSIVNFKGCGNCSYLQFVETANAVNISLNSILKGLKYHLG